MDEQNPSNAEHEPKTYINVSFEYDESTRALKAILAQTLEDPQITFQTLNSLMTQEEYAPFKISTPKIQELLRTVQKGEACVMELAIKPEYTKLAFEYNEETRVLSGVLTPSEEDLGLNLMKVQETIRELGYEDYGICNVNVQNLVKKISSNERGTYPVGKKPEYTDVKLVFNPETNELHANLSQSETDLGFTVETINEMIQKLGYDTFCFEEGVLVKLAENIQKNVRGNVLLAHRTDALLDIELSDDHMEARLSVTPAFGGKDLTMDTLKETIGNERIQWDLCDESKLQEAIESQSASKVLFAQGVQPIDGEDSTFEPLVKAIVKRGPRIDEKDKAHLRDIKEFTIVDADTPLMKRIKATPGTSGVNVLGLQLDPIPGTDIPFEEDLLGAKVSSDDKDILISTQKGSPIVTERGVKIDNVLRFKDIDMHTGNVSLDGCIFIEGNVRSGMVVEASGGVIIEGAVHNATIIAGEDIVVGEGVIGSKVSEVDCENNTARLTAGGNIQANFVNLAVLQAKKDIVINQYITHSDVVSEGKVIVGKDDGKGQIIGGRTNAVGGVECKIIGAKSNILTKITAGFPLSMKQRYKQLKIDQIEQMDKVIQKSNKLDKLKEKYIQTPSDANQTLLDECEAEFKDLDKILTATNKEISDIEKAILRYDHARVVASETIYEQTQLNINGAKKTFKETHPNGAMFACIDKRISLT